MDLRRILVKIHNDCLTNLNFSYFIMVRIDSSLYQKTNAKANNGKLNQQKLQNL